jgi:stage IV sporulation protein FA
VFLFKLLASACLFLVIAILFRNHTATLDSTRNVVKKTMETEFQFATVSNWYENKFGKPLALFPFTDKKTNQNLVSNPQYAVPASGRILENFQKNGQGIMIERGKGTKVEAMNAGIVRFAGEKDGLGKTVIIQHSDQTESWYGNLESINVNLYEYVDKGKKVGTVSGSAGKDKSKGEFYFAIKKGDHFIDPIQVIRFE